MTSLKTSIKTITYLSDIGCLEIHGASLAISTNTWKLIEAELKTSRILAWREMMELRTRYEIHRLDLIAYIIQSGAEVDNFYRITPKISNNTSNQRQPNESDCHN